MTLVDRWVVREAFTWISQLMDEQKVVPHLAINLSGASVTDDSFMEYLLEQISEFGVGTSRLCFEITETGTISNLVKAADFVRAFQEYRLQIFHRRFWHGTGQPQLFARITCRLRKDRRKFHYWHRQKSQRLRNGALYQRPGTFPRPGNHRRISRERCNHRETQEIGVDYLQGWGVGRPKPLAEVTADLSNLEK